MSSPSENPWSQTPHSMYLEEKADFAGVLVGGIFYGIVVVLSLQCLGALLTDQKRGARWILVAHTSAIFSLVTVYTAMSFNIQSVSYVDNREFPGVDDAAPPGPLGHQVSAYLKADNVARTAAYVLSNWLTDGFLLYRFWIIFSSNLWLVTFPFLAYLTSFAFGILLIYQTSLSESSLGETVTTLDLGYLYYLISPSFNIFLTLIIVVRFVEHKRAVRKGLGGSGGRIDAVIVIFIESCALYTVSFLLYVVPWGARSFVADIFFPAFVQVQAIAPLLVIIRIASLLPVAVETADADATIHFRSQGDSVGGNEIVVDGVPPVGPMEVNAGIFGENGVEDTISEVTIS